MCHMDDCIIYPGTKNKRGYGILPRAYNGSRLAHRMALSLALGRPVDGLALHTCDNPPCVNPRHLREGTHAENMQDKKDRERSKGAYSEATHCVHGHEFTPENTVHKADRRVKSGTTRICLTCRTERNKEIAAKRKAERHKRGLKSRWDK